MRNILLTMRFDGSPFHGWQVQQNGITVQETLQNAIEGVFGIREAVTGCSRTDAGVHANMYCCNFRTASPMECEKIICALNAWLPDSVGIYDCRDVPDIFHARYSCKSKEYVYKIWNSPYKNPFYTDKYTFYKYPIDTELLCGISQAYVGTHDYKGFAASKSVIKDTVRTVKHFSVSRNGDEVFFRVEADGFLYNMVRIMTGTLLDIGSGKLGYDSLPEIISSGERDRAGVTAPPQGLYLNRVFY